MAEGRTKTAIQLLNNCGDSRMGRPLNLNDTLETPKGSSTVRGVLLEKHPPAQPCELSIPVPSTNDTLLFHPVLFNGINSTSIQLTALKTKGSHGPSGLDAAAWHRMCCSFKEPSRDLCEAMAKVAKRLASGPIDLNPVQAFTASRLIALDKCPGVRPIGVGEVSRRIIAKAILSVISKEIQQVAGTYQLCAGQKGGGEAAVHAMTMFLEEENTEGLFVDATNVLNSLNYEAALRNVQSLCPSLANVVLNTYRLPPTLYINGTAITSAEGTTQGNPLAMSIHTVAILPLIMELDKLVIQLWFADDAAAAGCLQALKQWWDLLTRRGPKYGYFANPAKMVLVVKERHLDLAKTIFSGSGVLITTDGKSYFGSFIGPDNMKEQFVQAKVEAWKAELGELTYLYCKYTTPCCFLCLHTWDYQQMKICVQDHRTD